MEPTTSSTGSSSTTMWIIVVIVVILAIVGFFMIRNGSTVTPGNGTSTTTPTAISGQRSLAQLVALGSAQECTFSEASSQTEGTVYVANGKVRGDFRTIENGQTMLSHMISDGSTIYTWVDGMSVGVTMPASSAQSGSGQSQGVGINDQLNYDCKGWSPNATAFVPPSDVQFTSLSAMIGVPQTP